MSNFFLREDIEDAIVDWCERNLPSDYTVYWTDEDGIIDPDTRDLDKIALIKPEAVIAKIPYVTLKIINSGEEGTGGFSRRTIDDDTSEYKENMTATLSINLFGSNGYWRDVNRLKSSWKLPSELQEMKKVNVAFLNPEGVNDLSQSSGTKKELRAQFDIIFRYSELFNDSDGSIKKIGISGEFNNE